jgi:hypothetical protein
MVRKDAGTHGVRADRTPGASHHKLTLAAWGRDYPFRGPGTTHRFNIVVTHNRY